MKKNIVLITCILVLSFICDLHSQTVYPKGKAHIIEFNNTTAKFTVPAGKTWYIVNIFSDYFTDFIPNSTSSEINIFLKSLDGTVITDLSINKVGTKVYSGVQTYALRMPLIFPENTVFELIIISGELSKPNINNSIKAFLNYVECDN
jgi:hypothetical protein